MVQTPATYFKDSWHFCIEQIAWNPYIMKKHTCDRGQFGKPWQDTQDTMTVTSAVGGWANGSCALHPRKEDWEPAHRQEMFPNILHEAELHKREDFFFSRCVRRDFSRLWGRCFVSCNMRKTVALCPGMDNLTKRTLWGEVWCERSASPKLSPGLVA